MPHTPRRPLPVLAVRDATEHDILENAAAGCMPHMQPAIGYDSVAALRSKRNARQATAAVCVAVTIGGKVIALWRTDDYPGECVWAAEGCRAFAENAVNAWCDLMIASDIPEPAPRPVA